MSTNRSGHPLTEYMAIAISPVLIMALVGSLVFFLVEVLYAGQYEWRLQWILFFFVFGTVLIARISMMGEIANRSGLYGLVLGLVVWLALQAFVEYPPGSTLARFSALVNLGLMGLTWWCAHRLTWDCTFIDEAADATGQGVLQAAGLEKPPDTKSSAEELPPEEDGETNTDGKRPGWLERYRRYQEERRRKHTPGVWVVYFSLAALPLFGLGQSLIPPDELGRRRYAFWLLGIYVASGLGLLLTTAFLGLRRYLRQRGLKMPAAVTGVWLSLGLLLIVAVLAAGALLPRPHAEYSAITRLGSPERQASDWAVKRDGSGKGEGRASSDSTNTDVNEGTGKKGQAGGKEPGDGSGKSGDPNDPDKQGTGGPGDREGKQGEGSGGKGGSGSGGQQQGKQGGQGREQSKGQDASGKPESGSNPPSTPSSPFSGLLSGIMNVLKWVVFALLALVVAFVVLRALLQFLGNFTGWAKGLLDSLRALWQSLFGWLQRPEQAETEVEMDASPASPLAFSSFSNPFVDGSSQHLPPEELIRYSFSALQAWAWEHELGREPGETPLEFAGRIGAEVPALEAEVHRLAALFVHTAYSRTPLPAGCTETLQQFWQRLEAVTEQPLSA